MNAPSLRTGAILSGVLFGTALVHMSWCIEVPVRIKGTRLVEIKPGMSVTEISNALAASRVIRSRLYFEMLARLDKTPLKAGEYGFGTTAMRGVLRKLRRGEVFLHRVTIPEGSTISDISRLLDRTSILRGDDFAAAASSGGMLARLGVAAASLEGYLFPDTYLLPKGTSGEGLAGLMVRRFRERVSEEIVASARLRGLDLKKLVILASIVEKEARVSGERGVIAGVFHNRLKRKMMLQADPTVRYAMSEWERKLTRTDLRIDSPYNTYRYRGLPPGPICNPGLASIRAAAAPAEVPYLYFVTLKDGSGRHDFSSTLKEHLEAVVRSKSRVSANNPGR